MLIQQDECYLAVIIVATFLLILPPPTLTTDTESDATGKKVEFYPSSLMISHTAKPLLFFSDTKLMNLVTKMKPVELGPKLTMNSSCTAEQQSFFNQLLESLHHMQKTLTRILSTPAFSNLLECDLYLCRYFTYLTGMPSSMSCHRAYHSSIAECKFWALGSCKSIRSVA